MSQHGLAANLCTDGNPRVNRANVYRWMGYGAGPHPHLATVWKSRFNA